MNVKLQNFTLLAEEKSVMVIALPPLDEVDADLQSSPVALD
jgi:hypothetical protein